MLNPKFREIKPSQLLRTIDAVYTLTEFGEFASRLAQTEAGGDRMYIEMALCNTEGRTLWMESTSRGEFLTEYKSTLADIPKEFKLDRAELIARRHDIALEAAQFIFQRFGWEAPIDVVRSIQSELVG